MAISRCLKHRPKGRTRNYVAHVPAYGHPNSAVVCGSKYCRDAGYLWLEQYEKDAYDSGERIFQSFTATMKMRAAD